LNDLYNQLNDLCNQLNDLYNQLNGFDNRLQLHLQHQTNNFNCLQAIIIHHFDDNWMLTAVAFELPLQIHSDEANDTIQTAIQKNYLGLKIAQ
jgi:hypothetical protein